METLAQPWAFAAVGACAAILICAVCMRKRVGTLTIAWTLPFAAASIFFAIWCARGLCSSTPLAFCSTHVIIAILGIAVLQRERPVHKFEAFAKSKAEKPCTAALGCAIPWIRDVAIIAIASLFSFLALEIADNPDWTLIEPALFARGLSLVILAIAGLYFLGQRRGVLCIAVPAVCAIFGLVQVFLDLFKNTALLPSDAMAWKTAAAVSGGYTYVIPESAIACIACALVAVALLAYIVPVEPIKRPGGRSHAIRIAGCLAASALCACGIWIGTTLPDYQQDLGIELDYWDLRNSYHENGFLVSFIAATQDLVIQKPAGYTDESARTLQEELARLYDEELADKHETARLSFAGEQTSVIAIMNESYADLSIFEALHDDYKGTYVTSELVDASVSGWLDMSVHGGGTCNSEYEFLALSSMAFVGSGMYPYQQFNFAKTETLPQTFKRLGYGTWAMHPSYPGNWSREFVYATMGFSKSLFVYDFEGADEFHSFVSDRATYDRALEILRSADGPQFILDITMQNHSGYDTDSIPVDQLTSIEPDFLDNEATATLNEYLSCIHASDKALQYLLDELEKLDEHIAVVFFGDHQPAFSRDLNDVLFVGEGELAHKARIASVPYFIWTNYDVGSIREPDVESSANYLGAQLLEAIGAPLSDYQKALLYLHQKVRAVNTNGFCDEAGVWHDADEGSAEDHPYHQLQVLHYLNVVRNL